MQIRDRPPCALIFHVLLNTHLLRKLFFTEFVKGIKFLGKYDVFDETAGSQFDSNDDASVRHHHSDRSENNLQIFR